VNIDYKLDVNGEVCPIPAAETRRMLRKMDSGKTLEVIGDFDQAILNVINMAEKNGAEVIEKENRSDYFRVVVKKL